MKFPVVLMDWPWRFETWSEEGQGRAPDYQLLTIADFRKFYGVLLPVLEDHAAVFVWVTWPIMAQATRIIESEWGLHYATCAFNWIKYNQDGIKPFTGMGYYTRSNSEPCLLFKNGQPLQRKSKSESQIVEEDILTVRGQHSAKPEIVQDRIERLFDGPYLELFARRERHGWTCLGNEIDGRDIREALNDLAHKER